MTNCAVEEIGNKNNEQDSISLIDAKNWFEKYKSTTQFKPEFNDLNFDWENSKVENLENNSQAVVVPVFSPNEDENYAVKKFLYFYPVENATFQTTLYELKSSKKSLEGQDMAEALSYFNGYINVWNLEKGFVESTKFENSVAKATFSGEEKQRTFSINASGKMAMDPPVASICLGELILCNGYKDEGGSFYEMGYVYTVNNYGFSGDYAGSYFNTSHGSGGGGAGGGSGVSVINITNKLTGKAKCLNDLLNKNGNSFIQNLFSKFKGTSKFDIAISSADVVLGKKNGVEREINGRTLMPKGKLIEIEISTSRVNARAPIEVARIILHEYIHADIYRKLGTELATNVENLDFKTTYEKYEGEQHSVMAKLYVDSMKESLKQFHQSLFPGDISAYTAYYGEAPNDAFYEALAWGGLRDEDVKAWNELSAAKKASIEALASRVERFSKTSPCSN